MAERTAAVMFDMFSTLIEVRQTPGRAAAIAGRLGLEGQVYNDAVQAGIDAAQEQFKLGQISPMERMRRIAERAGVAITQGLASNLVAAEHSTALAASRFYPDTTSTLTGLQLAGYKQSIAANATPTDVYVANMFALRGRVNSSTFSCEVGDKQPNVSFYKTACERTGIAPEDTLLVSDDPQAVRAGVEGLGMHGYVLLHPDGVAAAQGPESYTDLPSIPDLYSLREILPAEAGR